MNPGPRNRSTSRQLTGRAVGVSRRTALFGAAALVSGAASLRLFTTPSLAAIGGELQIMAWEGYDLTVELEAWRKSSGVRVVTSSIAVQDDVQTKFVAGNPPPIDLAEYNQAYADLYIKQLKIVRPLDATKLSHYSSDNLFGVFHNGSHWYFDGKLWGAPYIWGYNTILYNPKHLSKPTSYADLLDPKLRGKIAIMDDTVSTWPVAARVAGFGAKYPYLTKAELGRTFDQLAKYREQARVIALNQGELANFMASGEVSAVLCADPAILTQVEQQGVKLDTSLPTEGPVLWVDAWFIPVSADNIDTAHAFIDQALSPQVQAKVAAAVNQAPVSRAALKFMDEQARARIDAANVEQLFKTAGLPGIPPIGGDGKHATYDDWVDAWQRFKAGM